MAAGQYQDIAIAAAQKYGVPQNMFLWQIGTESSWNPNARNPTSSATGIAQITKDTADFLKVDPLDPMASLDAAARYDAMLYKKWGSWTGALEHYGTLHDASSDKIAGFKNALGYDADSGTPNVSQDLKDFGQGAASPNNWMEYLKSGAIIILGIVIIVVAILSNKTVQSTVVTAVTKGK